MSMPSWIAKNLYIDDLPHLNEKNPTVSYDEQRLRKLELPGVGPFGNCNMLKLRDGRNLLYVRAFGYSLLCDGIRKPHGFNDWFFFLDDGCRNWHRLNIVSPGIDARKVEDLRLYYNNDTIMAVGSYVSSLSPVNEKHIAEIALFSMCISGTDIIVKMEYRSGTDTAISKYQSPGEWQKNWMPIAGKEDTFVQKIIPGKIRVFGPTKGTMNEHEFDTSVPLFGGPPLISYGDRYLMLCHRKDANIYRSILIEMTKEYSITRHSGWFRFSSYPIEFCTCMALEKKESIVFLYTLMDQMTFVTEIGINDLLKQFGKITP